MPSTPLSRLLAGAFVAACAAASLHAIPPSIAGAYNLIWWDDFDGTALNRGNWDYDTNARRDAVNTTDAVSVANGAVTITTYTVGGQTCTGFILSKEKFSQDFGYYEARIMFNDTSGMWSAFWLMPYDMSEAPDKTTIAPPATGGVEMDIVEHRKITGGQDIENVINNGLHWNGYNVNPQKTNSQSTQPTLANGTWHTYGLLWTPAGCTFYFDDQPIWQTSAAVSHRSSHVLLTSEVLTNGWAGNTPAGGYGTLAASTTRMTTDYVRVYALKPSVSGESPAVAHPFPGRVEAEKFDLGGQDVAVFKTGGAPVDLATDSAASGGSYVTNFGKPEWLSYTLTAQTPGYYYANALLATTATAYGQARVSIDGVSLGTVKVQNTGGWRTLTLPGLLKVDAPCTFVAKAEFMTGGMTADFDALDFVYLGNVADQRAAGAATLADGAAIVTTPHTSGGSSADLQTSGASATWTGVNGFDGGPATLTLRYCASGVPTYTRVCSLVVNNVAVATFSLPSTGSNAFVNIQQPVTLDAGAANTIRLVNAGQNGKPLNLDCIVVSKVTGDGSVVPGPAAFPVVRPAASRLADGETAVTLVDDDFTGGSTADWSVSHERLLDTVSGATISTVPGSGLNGRALSLASTVNFRSALRAFAPVTLAVGDSLTVTFDYRFPDGPWNNANGLWAGFADSSQTILRDLAQADTSSNHTWPAFYATANPAGQAGGSYIKIDQGNGATATNLGSVYATAASGTTKRSATITFTRTGATTLEITSDLGRFGLTPDTITATATTSWFTFDRFFVVKGSGSANLGLYLDNVQVVYHGQ